jgi:hypothetical protein
MKAFGRLSYLMSVMTLLVGVVRAEVRITSGHSAENSGFSFPDVSPPANNDAATTAVFSILEGEGDPNGGKLAVLNDGRVPLNEDHPERNFFFTSDTNGGRILVDLGRVIPVQQISSYSWHPGVRAPQIYKLYAASGAEEGFNLNADGGNAPVAKVWTLIASVDTRSPDGGDTGQHAVTIAGSEGVLGQFRYLIFEISRTNDRDRFGQTFYSEIDVVDANGPVPTSSVEKPILTSFQTDDGQFHFTMDTTVVPDLTEWCDTTLQPVVCEWYPKIVGLLPSEEFQPPKTVALRFREDMGGTPASASGAAINLNAAWFRTQLQREATGAVVHELVHVVQQYRRRRTNPRAIAPPGWIVEGIPDYIRWFLYEPHTRGAEITKRTFPNARYDSSYRISANFLNWVTETHDKELVRKLNAAARQGSYEEGLWVEWTGKSLDELGDDWKQSHRQRLQIDQ